MLAGVLIELVADNQLHDHKHGSDAKSLLRSGLWAYSRHPNYLGQVSYVCVCVCVCVCVPPPSLIAHQCVVWLGWALWGALRGARWWHVADPLNIVALVVCYSCDVMEQRLAAGPRAAQLAEYARHTRKLVPLLW